MTGRRREGRGRGLAAWIRPLPRWLPSLRRRVGRRPRRTAWARFVARWRWVHAHRRLAAALAAAVVLVGAGLRAGPPFVAWVRDHPYFAVEEIVVAPTHHLHPGELLEWAGIRPGMSIWSLPPAAVASRLAAHPWIRRAVVRRELPHRLVVEVVERVPAAVVMLDRFYYVDRFGVIFAPLDDHDRLDLPLVTGLAAADVPMRRSIRDALKVLRTVQAAALPFRVSEVHIEREQGIQVFPVDPPVAVTFGWGRIRAKTERLAEVLAAFAGREGEIREIDLTFRTQAVIRLRGT